MASHVIKVLLNDGLCDDEIGAVGFYLMIDYCCGGGVITTMTTIIIMVVEVDGCYDHIIPVQVQICLMCRC